MDASRVGFGLPHPALVNLLERLHPVAIEFARWGPLHLRFEAYLAAPRLPQELITSVRCVVRVADQVVATRTADDVNVWPGGRREEGESIRATVVREVFEETGCRLDPTSLRPLGFLNAEHLVPPPADYQYPHPHFLQLIFAGKAFNAPIADWKDLDGYVQAAWLATAEEAKKLSISPLSIPFLDAAARNSTK